MSDYTDESEVILFGGGSILQISRIDKMERGEAVSFENELRAIQAIRAFARGASSHDMLSVEVKSTITNMVESVLKSTVEDQIPSPYIRQLLMHQIEQASRSIVFDYYILLEKFDFLHDVILYQESDQLLRIDQLCNLFPNSAIFTFIMPATIPTIGNANVFWNAVFEDISRIDRYVTISFEWSGNDYGPLQDAAMTCQEHYDFVEVTLQDSAVTLRNKDRHSSMTTIQSKASVSKTTLKSNASHTSDNLTVSEEADPPLTTSFWRKKQWWIGIGLLALLVSLVIYFEPEPHLLVAILTVLLFIVVIIVLCIWKIRKRQSSARRVLPVKMSNISSLWTVDVGVIACISIGKYDKSENNDLSVRRDVENLRTFSRFMRYDFIERPNKLYWTEEDVESFLMNDIGNSLFRQNGKPKCNVLMICICAHGLRDQIVTSDGHLMDKTAIPRMISVHSPRIRDIPRIFVFDTPARSRQFIPAGPKMHHLVADSIEDTTGEIDLPVIGRNLILDDFKVEGAWTSSTRNPDYKLVVISSGHVDNGFPAKMRNDEVGSLLLYLLTNKLRRNIEDHEQKALAEIMNEIQEELHDARRLLIECIFNNGTRNLVLEMRPG